MKLSVLIASISMIAGLTACMNQPDYRVRTDIPETVASVDLERYSGTWYEIARYPNSFEKGCMNTKANYALRGDGDVAVTNSCKLADGSMKVAEGRARKVEGSAGAKLKVKFAPAWVPFAEGDYWIFHLEPDYSAALVGDPSGKYLWILARSEQPALSVIDRVLETARGLGFETAPLAFAEEYSTNLD